MVLAPDQKPSYAKIELGVRVDRWGDPREDEPLRIDADLLAAHTIVIAQAGSGKSTLLARLVEEVLIKTGPERATCIIIDPNADFRYANKLALDWSKPGYDHQKRVGNFLSGTKEEFGKAWEGVTKTILFGEFPTVLKEPRRLVKIRWRHIPFDMISQGLDEYRRGLVRQCHVFFGSVAGAIEVEIATQLAAQNRRMEKEIDFVQMAEDIHDDLRTQENLLASKKLDLASREQLIDQSVKNQAWALIGGPVTPVRTPPVGKTIASVQWPDTIRSAAVAYGYFTEDDAKFYFSALRSYDEKAVLRDKRTEDPDVRDLEVLDLPSISKSDLVPFIVLAQLRLEWSRARSRWEKAHSEGSEEEDPGKEGTSPEAGGSSREDDKRSPRFIVIDEAHNLAPAEPKNVAQRALAEQLRTIAAEGRKYGLFLVLASQRPDKLDPAVISECENIAVMRLGSDVVLEKTSTTLGLGDVVRDLRGCVNGLIARAWLYGKWTDFDVVPIHVGRRRTRQGGENLPAKDWAVGTPPSAPKPR